MVFPRAGPACCPQCSLVGASQGSEARLGVEGRLVVVRLPQQWGRVPLYLRTSGESLS